MISITGNSPVKVAEDGAERDLFYNDNEGGSGTEVVANPEGEATAELEKLQIGTTVYSVGGSGGLLIVNLIERDDTVMFDKTWKEVANAGFAVVRSELDEEGFFGVGWSVIEGAEATGGDYSCSLSTGDVYATDSEDGYPTIT